MYLHVATASCSLNYAWVLVFAHTLEDHLKHLKLAITRLQEAGLKLKPSKCHFIREEVEYLGHVITP